MYISISMNADTEFRKKKHITVRINSMLCFKFGANIYYRFSPLPAYKSWFSTLFDEFYSIAINFKSYSTKYATIINKNLTNFEMWLKWYELIAYLALYIQFFFIGICMFVTIRLIRWRCIAALHCTQTTNTSITYRF